METLPPADLRIVSNRERTSGSCSAPSGSTTRMARNRRDRKGSIGTCWPRMTSISCSTSTAASALLRGSVITVANPASRERPDLRRLVGQPNLNVERWQVAHRKRQAFRVLDHGCKVARLGEAEAKPFEAFRPLHTDCLRVDMRRIADVADAPKAEALVPDRLAGGLAGQSEGA